MPCLNSIEHKCCTGGSVIAVARFYGGFRGGQVKTTWLPVVMPSWASMVSVEFEGEDLYPAIKRIYLLDMMPLNRSVNRSVVRGLFKTAKSKIGQVKT